MIRHFSRQKLVEDISVDRRLYQVEPEDDKEDETGNVVMLHSCKHPALQDYWRVAGEKTDGSIKKTTLWTPRHWLCSPSKLGMSLIAPGLRRRKRHPEEDQLFADNRRLYHYFQTSGTTSTPSTTSSSSINSADAANSNAVFAETSSSTSTTTTTTTTTTKSPDEDYLTGTGEGEVSDEVSWNLEAQNAFTDIKVLELPASLGFTDRLASLEGLMGACSIEVGPANGSLTSMADSSASSSSSLRRCASRDFLFPSVVSTSVGVVIDWDSIEGTTADEIWDMFQRLLADETLFRPVRLSSLPASLRSSSLWRDAEVQKPRLPMASWYLKRGGGAVAIQASLVLPTLLLLVSLIVP
ncbi:unnamed protein product [Dibothriocephalus latus]|uniref:Uncharacterized protein n=1 Tax=Dibothriocephalus latus TaxID=60516 RepID=A0A3P7L859_DIBLA|nr:unnamed protein product [Dibothriocephalus latus]